VHVGQALLAILMLQIVFTALTFVQFGAAVEQRAANGDCLWLDPAKTSFGIYSIVNCKGTGSSADKKRQENGAAKKRIVEERSPIQLAKAIKVPQVAIALKLLCCMCALSPAG
jgi:hypothetical protein